MDTITITLEEVSRTAGIIRKENICLDQCLQDIYQCMNQLTNEWQSPAASTIRNKMQSMLPIFNTYKEIVDNYAKFLDQTVTSYQTMESKLNASAQSFQ